MKLKKKPPGTKISRRLICPSSHTPTTCPCTLPVPALVPASKVPQMIRRPIINWILKRYPGRDPRLVQTASNVAPPKNTLPNATTSSQKISQYPHQSLPSWSSPSPPSTWKCPPSTSPNCQAHRHSSTKIDPRLRLLVLLSWTYFLFPLINTP